MAVCKALVYQMSGDQMVVDQNDAYLIDRHLIWPIFTLVIILSIFYAFAILANWIAAPFNGLLSEAVEKKIAGKDYDGLDMTAAEVVKDLPRLLGREWHKFKYWLPKALICLVLFVVTGVHLIAPIIWILFSAWMMCIQYVDYPQDNRKRPFEHTLELLRQNRSGPMGFGLVIVFFTMIPVVNILVMPVAVAGATIMWFEQYKN